MQVDATFFPQRSIAELHEHVLNEAGGGTLGKQAALSVGIGRSLGVKLGENHEFRLSSTNKGIELDKNADEAKVILRTDRETWENLASESWSMMGLILQNKISLLAGQFHHLAAWEAPLQALYNNRPIFSNEDIPDEEPYIFDYGFDF